MNKNWTLPVIYFSTAGLCLIGSAAWLSQRSDDSLNPNHSQNDAPASSANVNATRISLSASVVERFSQSLLNDELPPKDLASSIVALDFDGLHALSVHLRQAFEADPAKAKKWLTALGLELSDLGHHMQALDLINYLATQDGIADVERKVMNHWLENDLDGLRGNLADRARDGLTDTHHLALVASLIQAEKIDEFSSWAQWIEALGQKNQSQFQGQLLAKVISHSNPDTISTVASLVRNAPENAYLLSYLPELVSKLKPGDPEAALAWISTLEVQNESLRADTFAAIVNDLALKDPDQAAEIITADNFLTKYYHDSSDQSDLEEGEWSPGARVFFDRTLEAYVKGLGLVDPESALQSSKSFFNPELRDQYVPHYTNILANPDLQKDLLHENCPGCQDGNQSHNH